MSALDTSGFGELAYGEVESERVDLPQLAAALALAAPSASAGASALLPALDVDLDLPAPGAGGGAHADLPAAIALQAALGAPSAATGASVLPPALDVDLTLWGVGASGGALALLPEAVGIVLAAQEPSIATGASVLPPALDVDLTLAAPVVYSGATIQLPALGIELDLPALEAGGGARVPLPAVAVVLAAQVPGVGTGAIVSVPAVDLGALTLLVPSAATGASVQVPALDINLSLQTPVIIVLDLETPNQVYAAILQPAVIGWEFDADVSAYGEEVYGAAPAVSRVYVGELIRVATRPFGTEATDTPASAWFRGRLGELSLRRTLNNGVDFSGLVLGDGALTIDNTDGYYDGLIQRAIAGATITIKAGPLGTPYDSWRTIAVATARGWDFDEGRVRVLLRDDSYRLSVPIQSALFAGTGGDEGGADLAGKRRPLLVGYGSNVSPPLVDKNLLTYQVTSGSMDAVLSVRDEGAALTFDADYATYALLAAATIAAGRYATCLAAGYIRLQSSPAGQVTATAVNYRASGVADLASIMRSVLEDIAGLTAFDEASFTTLRAAYPTEHGTWVSENDSPTVAEVVADLMGGVMGFVGFRRNGDCYVDVVDAPTGAAAASYGDGALFDIRLDTPPARLAPPSWRRQLNYDRNHTVQPTLAGSADPAWKQPGRTAVAQDAAVLSDFLLAQDPAPTESGMRDQAAAEAEAARQLALLKELRLYRRALLPRQAIILDPGSVVELAPDRLGGARRGIVVEDNIEIGDGVDTVELGVYG